MVKLSPHIYDQDVEQGFLHFDVCISNIRTRVDSKNANCSWGPDKLAIHNAIKLLSSNGFDIINRVVELIRLMYLLNYPVHLIKGSSYSSEIEKKERRKFAVENHLVPSIVTMLQRVYSIAPSEVPNFKTDETQSELSEPIEVFLEWKKIIEALIEEKNRSNKSIKTS